MKDIKPLGFIFLEHGCDDRVDECLHRAVSEAKYYRPPIKQVVGFSPSSLQFISSESFSHYDSVCLEGQHCICGVTNEAKDHGCPIADIVDNQAEDDNTNCKGPDAGPEKFLSLNFIQSECAGPKRFGVYKKGSRDKCKGRCYEGYKAPPK